MNAPLARDILEPSSVEEAISILQQKGDEATIISGGTDLVIRLKEEVSVPPILVDILKLPLAYIRGSREKGFQIGATTTAREIRDFPALQKELPVLVEAALHLGGPQTQELATIGGNICNGSPCANFTNVLVALEAKIRIAGPKGERLLLLKDFYRGPGETELARAEIVTEVNIPPIARPYGASYLKHTLRREMDIAIVGAAVFLIPEGSVVKKIRIALGSVGPRTILAENAQKAIEGKSYSSGLVEEAARAAAEKDASYIDDVRSTGGYRRTITAVLVRRAIEAAWAKGKAR